MERASLLRACLFYSRGGIKIILPFMTEEVVVGGGSYCVTCCKCYRTFPSTFRKNKLARLDVKQFHPNLIFAVKAEAPPAQ
jgi:hypothetical protein